MIHLGHALTSLEPPVHALFVYNANPLCVNPDGSSVRRGLAREDLFTVVHEQVMTPTARYADLLLPATTFLENRDIYSAYGHFYLGVAGPVIEPIGEARSNFDLFQGLARRLGFTDPPFLENCEERGSVPISKPCQGCRQGWIWRRCWPADWSILSTVTAMAGFWPGGEGLILLVARSTAGGKSLVSPAPASSPIPIFWRDFLSG